MHHKRIDLRRVRRLRKIADRFLAKGRFIVKVQVPITTNLPPGEEQCLVYNRDRTVECMFPVTKEINDAMAGDLKQFFYAYMKGTVLHLDGIAPWQGW